MKKRKTYTSPEVKNRWNAAHYDRIQLNLPKGGAAELKAIAAEQGMAVSAYIRKLIIHDNAENPESTQSIRGGGYEEAAAWIKSLLGGCV